MLNSKSTYSEIKSWFLENWNDLPDNLRGGHKYYMDVKSTAKIYMNQIEHILSTDPKRIKSNKIAISAKRNLLEMYHDLQDRSQWNLGYETIEDIYGK